MKEVTNPAIAAQITPVAKADVTLFNEALEN